MAYQPKNPNGQATMANSGPVVIASDQSAVPVSVSTLPGVQFQDVYVTGKDSQTAGNQNIILASAGTGSYDTLNGTTGISFRSVSIQITPAAGTVTAGVITFEGSNDNTNFVQVFLSDNANITAVPVATVTLAASTPRHFVGTIPFRYFRARISTGITGTTTGVQAHTVFSTVPFSSPRLTVSQAVGASLNVAVSSAPSTAVTMAANATTTPAKARDVASGANDTGIPAWHVRRDTPTTVTPVAGDWEPSQIDSMGSQWVREKSSTTSALTNVAASATNVTVLALNAQRRGAAIYNDSTAILYLKLGAIASATSFTIKMQPDSYYEVPAQYTGVIDGIWASATGSARVTEVTS